MGLFCLLDLMHYVLFHVEEIFNYNLFKNFLRPFLFLFFWDPYNLNVGAFDIVPEVSETIFSFFNSFFFILLFRFILYGSLCVSWTLLTMSFSMLGKLSTIIFSKIFSYPFFFSSSSGTPIVQMSVLLILSQRSLRLSSVLFILFTLFCSLEVISTILSYNSLIRSSASIFCYSFLLEYF